MKRVLHVFLFFFILNTVSTEGCWCWGDWEPERNDRHVTPKPENSSSEEEEDSNSENSHTTGSAIQDKIEEIVKQTSW
jgi:hypothetical protein